MSLRDEEVRRPWPSRGGDTRSQQGGRVREGRAEGLPTSLPEKGSGVEGGARLSPLLLMTSDDILEGERRGISWRGTFSGAGSSGRHRRWCGAELAAPGECTPLGAP